MNLFVRALRVLLVAVPLAALAPSPASAQTAPCQFILGFKTLHDLDAADIGDCVNNQAFAGNGDAQQQTTKGLMAWRKADNWTAFTNGYQTWINGPSGLVKRLNTERFPWEADAGAGTVPSSAAAVAAPPAAVSTSAGSSPSASTDSALPPGYTVDSAGRLITPSGAVSREAAPGPVVPAGATAICRDGTYSFSATHSGTCSHHGGVATWYA